MKKNAVTIAAIAALSLSLGLAGCSSGKNDAKSSTSSSSSSSTSATSSKTSAPSTTAQASGPSQTIDDYLQQNNIQATLIKHDTPGAPNIDLPVPDGWTLIPEGDDAPYGGIVLNNPSDPADAPKVIATLHKLTGNVDQEKLFAVAPGDMNNLTGFQGMCGNNVCADSQPATGDAATLAGFPAVEVGGFLTKGDKKFVVGQKTVLIKGTDTYLLQLNVKSPEADVQAVGPGLDEIDSKTTITV